MAEHEHDFSHKTLVDPCRYAQLGECVCGQRQYAHQNSEGLRPVADTLAVEQLSAWVAAAEKAVCDWRDAFIEVAAALGPGFGALGNGETIPNVGKLFAAKIREDRQRQAYDDREQDEAYMREPR